MNTRRLVGSLALGFAAALAPAIAQEQSPGKTSGIQCDSSIVNIAGFEPAKPSTRPLPRFPRGALDDWSEGWVQLNFNVGADGAIKDVIAIDALGSKAFVTATLRAFQAWDYTPAKRNGIPVEQYGVDFIFEYRIADTPDRGATHRDFIERYNRARALIGEGNANEAIEWLQRALSLRTNLYESAMGSYLLAVAHLKRNDRRAALFHIRHATKFGEAYLEPSAHKSALALRVHLESDDGNYRDAICEHQTLLKAVPAGDPDTAKLVAKIEAALASPAPMAAQGFLSTHPAIDGPAIWSHAVLRPRFHFAQIEGDVKSFRLVCVGTVLEAAVDTETEWTIPPAAGNCVLRVMGAQGSKFQLVETW